MKKLFDAQVSFTDISFAFLQCEWPEKIYTECPPRRRLFKSLKKSEQTPKKVWRPSEEIPKKTEETLEKSGERSKKPEENPKKSNKSLKKV